MTVALTMCVYDRPDLLDRALNCLTNDHPSGADHVFVYGDGPTNPDVIPTVCKHLQMARGASLVHGAHVGIATGNNVVMDQAVATDDVDVIIRMDSDITVLRAGWVATLADFLRKHPEIGILAPNLPGRYMRIHRDGYDEIEYALGMIMAVRRDVYAQLNRHKANGFLDSDISHQWDPDVCYRVRDLGYRVGIIDIGEVVDLGTGTGDSSRITAQRGGFEFLKKWNIRFLGNHFRYKSPYMLRWDEFPLNYLWRREWLAQFPYNERPRVEMVQDHKFEMIEMPITPSKWLLPQTRDGLRIHANYSGLDDFDRIDPELLTGARNWNVGDLKRQELA
jgi:GT2 family glycosyltransferase